MTLPQGDPVRTEAHLIASLLRETDHPPDWTVEHVEAKLRAWSAGCRRQALLDAADEWWPRDPSSRSRWMEMKERLTGGQRMQIAVALRRQAEQER